MRVRDDSQDSAVCIRASYNETKRNYQLNPRVTCSFANTYLRHIPLNNAFYRIFDKSISSCFIYDFFYNSDSVSRKIEFTLRYSETFTECLNYYFFNHLGSLFFFNYTAVIKIRTIKRKRNPKSPELISRKA